MKHLLLTVVMIFLSTGCSNSFGPEGDSGSGPTLDLPPEKPFVELSLSEMDQICVFVRELADWNWPDGYPEECEATNAFEEERCRSEMRYRDARRELWSECAATVSDLESCLRSRLGECLLLPPGGECEPFTTTCWPRSSDP